MAIFGFLRRRREPDGVPIRDGLTYPEDAKRVLDMLCLCGELDGIGPRESYSHYLRRILDRLGELERRL